MPMAPARLLPRLMTLLIALALSTALLPAAPASAEATRAQLTKKVKRLLFEKDLPDFTLIKRKAERKNDQNPLEWKDNGCSTPVPSPFNGRFNAACERHDFGYRNLGNGVGASPSRAFDSTESAKQKVDLQLKEDLLYSCRDYPGPNGDCNDAANTYYFFVSRAGKSWTSFYDRECTPGWFCLFDDSGYGDRRKRFSVSHDNMDDFDFGDKASAR